jgi:hypothetical protein
MLLVAIMVLTNTVSADGSIGGVYDAGLQLAARTSGNPKNVQELVGGESETPAAPAKPSEQKDQQKPVAKPKDNGHIK